MLEVNQKHLKRLETYSIFTIPKSMNYTGFQTKIPNKFISKAGFQRYINLPNNQKIKIRNEQEEKIVMLKDLIK